MAYWVQEISGIRSNYRSFICDYRNDIQKLPKVSIAGAEQKDDTISSLPCSYGSDCFCLEDSSVWILGKDTNEWKEV